MFLTNLKSVDPKRHTWIIIRETFFAFLILMIFMLFGQQILQAVQISEQALGVSGGLIMFLIGLRMIFPEEKNKPEKIHTSEPFIVPLAMPITAGPGAITTVMLFASQHPEQKLTFFFTIIIASIIVGIVSLGGRYLSKYLGDKGLIAIERFSGMLIIAMAVQMLLTGINSYFLMH